MRRGTRPVPPPRPRAAGLLYHKQLGIVALTLVAPRLLWRVGNVLPHLVRALPDWQKVIARFVHLCFYALMLALPVTGWLMSSATGIPVSVLVAGRTAALLMKEDRRGKIKSYTPIAHSDFKRGRKYFTAMAAGVLMSTRLPRSAC